MTCGGLWFIRQWIRQQVRQQASRQQASRQQASIMLHFFGSVAHVFGA